ncbi:hypothetical protein [Pedobacter sp. NJ-S-72]
MDRKYDDIGGELKFDFMIYRKGAIGGLLDEYERAIIDLLRIIEAVPDDELIRIADAQTGDENCRSIQTVFHMWLVRLIVMRFIFRVLVGF